MVSVIISSQQSYIFLEAIRSGSRWKFALQTLYLKVCLFYHPCNECHHLSTYPHFNTPLCNEASNKRVVSRIDSCSVGLAILSVHGGILYMHPKGNPRIDRSLLFLASCESEGMIPSKSGSLSCVCMHVCINVCLYVCLHIFGEFIGIQLLSVFLRCLFTPLRGRVRPHQGHKVS